MEFTKMCTISAAEGDDIYFDFEQQIFYIK
jgi:hypothetical protein